MLLDFIHRLTDWLTQSQDFFVHLGWLGVLLYAGGIGLLGVFCVPLSPVAAAGGAIFGFWRGFVAVTIGTALAAALNFLIARYLLRRPIERRLEKKRKHGIDVRHVSTVTHGSGLAGCRPLAATMSDSRRSQALGSSPSRARAIRASSRAWVCFSCRAGCCTARSRPVRCRAAVASPVRCTTCVE